VLVPGTTLGALHDLQVPPSSADRLHSHSTPNAEPAPPSGTADGTARSRRSGERYRLAVRATNDVVWDWDAHADDEEWSEALFTVFGWLPQQAKRSADGARSWWSERIHPDDRDRVVSSYQHALASTMLERWEGTYRFRRADDSYAHVVDRALIQRDGRGDVSRVVRALRDASESILATAALRESEARFRALVEASACAVWRADTEANLTEDLPGWRAVTGMRAEEILGRGWMRAIHPDDRERAVRCWREARDLRTGFELVHRLRVADGSYRWFSCRGVPVRDDARGTIREWVGMHEDIDARHRQEVAERVLVHGTAALDGTLESTEALRGVADAVVAEMSDACLVYLACDGALELAELACRDDSRVEALRTLAGHDGSRLPIAPAAVAHTGHAALRADPPPAAEAIREPAPDGSLAPYAALCVPIQGQRGTLGALAALSFGALRDRPLTERELATLEELGRRAGRAIEQARAFRDTTRAREVAEAASAAKSDFLAVLSHEIRTPLSSIIGYAQLLADGITGPVSSAQGHQLRRIVSGAEHLRTLIEEILTLSRIEAGRAEVHPAPVDLCALVDEAIDIVALAAQQKGLRLVRDVPATGCVVTTDRTKLLQALVNLAGNAVKFTERGEIGFRVRVLDDRAELEVRDTGVGIAPEHQRRIYEPFWRVDQDHVHPSAGTGLGLAVVRNLVQLLGGGIRTESRAGEGSRFTLWLPR